MRVFYILGNSAIPNKLQGEINLAVNELKSLKTKEQVLQKAYQIITTRYHGRRFNTLSRVYSLLADDAMDLWNRSGFMHCTNQNYLLTALLVGSGHFKQDDIKPKWSLYWWLTPHQYLRVRLGGSQFINLDPWSAFYGIGFGDYAHGFHISSKNKLKSK